MTITLSTQTTGTTTTAATLLTQVVSQVYALKQRATLVIFLVGNAVNLTA